MRLLELFCGFKSVSTIACSMGYECISLDINPKFNPDICMDIMEFNPKCYPRNYFDCIWASPECKIWSIVQNSLIGRKWESLDELNEERKHHVKFVEKTLEIIQYFSPAKWFIENPFSSKMKTLDCLQGFNFYVYDYCQYNDGAYKKPTIIWTNRTDLQSNRCKCKTHTKWDYIERGTDMTRLQCRYHIPANLIRYLLSDNIYLETHK